MQFFAQKRYNGECYLQGLYHPRSASPNDILQRNIFLSLWPIYAYCVKSGPGKGIEVWLDLGPVCDVNLA